MAKLLVIVAVLTVILGTQQIHAFTGTEANAGGEITVGVDGWVMDAAGQAKAAVVNVRLPRSGAYAASAQKEGGDNHQRDGCEQEAIRFQERLLRYATVQILFQTSRHAPGFCSCRQKIITRVLGTRLCPLSGAVAQRNDCGEPLCAFKKSVQPCPRTGCMFEGPWAYADAEWSASV